MKISFSVLFVILFASSLVFADESSAWKKLTDEAFILYQSGKREQAVAVTQKALEIAKQQFGPESSQAAESTGNLAALYEVQGKTAEAKVLFDKAMAIREKIGEKGIPLGLQSEVFFDTVGKSKAEGAERAKKANDPGVAQTIDNNDVRDFNSDGKVDDNDFIIFKKSLGKCRKDFQSTSDVLSDVDSDGCITLKDQKFLFPDK